MERNEPVAALIDLSRLVGSERDCSRTKGHSPGSKRVSRLFPVTIDGANRRPLLGADPQL
jgi:hypothetical protein